MKYYNPFRWFYILIFISLFCSMCTDGKGFGGGRGGGFGGKGGGMFGGKGSGSMSGSKGSGMFGGSSNYARGNNYGGYNNMGKPRSGSGIGKNALAFGTGVVAGAAGYSLLRSMSHSYHPGSYVYNRGYGGGETCINNEDMNGTRFGAFRCPLNEYSLNERYCCGEPNEQYCCSREGNRMIGAGGISFGGIFLFILLCTIVICLVVRCRRQRQKDIVLVPTEPPLNEPQVPPFYQPPPPPMGYPPPPNGNPYAQQPFSGNPYAPPPQNFDGNYNPNAYQQQTPYPQQQMPYPQQQMSYPQQPPYNPYQPKEGLPPGYDDAMYKK